MKNNQTHITLTNAQGEETTVAVSLVLNPKKLLFIERDYPEASNVLKMAVAKDSMELDMMNLYKSVYVAYRMANMNDYMTFDDFAEQYEFDMTEATNIFYALISKDFRSKYLKDLQNASKSADKSKQ